MARSLFILLVPLALLIGACAVAPLAADVVGSGHRQEAASDELECMSQCLEEDDEDCESCADHCLRHGSELPVAANI
jgi:hypothetical protein